MEGEQALTSSMKAATANQPEPATGPQEPAPPSGDPDEGIVSQNEVGTTAQVQGPGAPRSKGRVLLTRWGWLVVLLWVAAVFYLLTVLLPGQFDAVIYTYVVHPLLWMSVGLLAFLLWRFGLDVRPSFSGRLVFIATLVGVVQVALAVITGLLFGFGHSPYGHRALALLGNFFYLATLLGSMEMARAYLCAALGQRNNLLAVIIPTLLFTLVTIPLARYGALSDAPGTIELVGRHLLPSLSSNLLASFLALLGGPLASLAYQGVIYAFEWGSPILPDPDWIITAFVGTLVPLLGLLVVYQQFLVNEATQDGARRRRKVPIVVWLLVCLVAVGILFFNTGLLGIGPTLVSGWSMSPSLEPGDVVITRDVQPDRVAAGDIIRFRHDEVYILHRVQEIRDNEGKIEFVTRGDANSYDDPPVPLDAFEGKVVLVIREIGWVSIGVRGALQWLGIG